MKGCTLSIHPHPVQPVPAVTGQHHLPPALLLRSSLCADNNWIQVHAHAHTDVGTFHPLTLAMASAGAALPEEHTPEAARAAAAAVAMLPQSTLRLDLCVGATPPGAASAAAANTTANPTAGLVLWITLNRPATRNAMSWELISELHGAVDALRADPRLVSRGRVRAVVIRGAGKGFCSGADLKAAVTGKGGREWDSRRMESQRHFSSLIAKFHALPQPVLAAVHGKAAGGGLALALCADVRLAGESAGFVASFVKVGLSGCEMGTSYFLPRLVGHGRAREILMTARTVGAEEALAIGLVTSVVPDAELERATVATLESVLHASPEGLRFTKRQLNAAADGAPLATTLSNEDVCQVSCLQSDECMGVAARHTARFVAAARRSPTAASAASPPPLQSKL